MIDNKYRVIEAKTNSEEKGYYVEVCEGWFNQLINNWTRRDFEWDSLDSAKDQIKRFVGREIKSERVVPNNE